MRVIALVLDKVIDGIQVVMRMDVITQLGEVKLMNGEVTFGKVPCLAGQR